MPSISGGGDAGSFTAMGASSPFDPSSYYTAPTEINQAPGGGKYGLAISPDVGMATGLAARGGPVGIRGLVNQAAQVAARPGGFI